MTETTQTPAPTSIPFFTKETGLSVLRTLLTFAGFFLMGHHFLGHTVDSNIWDLLGGAASALLGTVWGIFDKSTGIEQIQSLVRSLFSAFSGVAAAWGLLSAQTIAAIGALIAGLLPILQSYTAKVKVVQLASGALVAQKDTSPSPQEFTGKVVKATSEN